MILNHPYLNRKISFDNVHMQLLIVENPRLFRFMVSQLRSLREDDGEMTLYDNQIDEKLSGTDHIFIISDYLNYDFSDRKLQSRLQQYFKTILSVEMTERCEELSEAIRNFMEEFRICCDIPIDYQVSSGMYPLLKAVDTNVAVEEEDSLSNLFEYLNVVNFLFPNSLNVLINCLCYYDRSEILELRTFAQNKKYNLLILQNSVPQYNDFADSTRIIDEDLCEI